MEWVETTAKTLDEAREMALDRLGVGADEAEFDVLEEPRPGLFGRLRGEARLRARVKPAQVRPKQERRRRRGGDRQRGETQRSDTTSTDTNDTDTNGTDTNDTDTRDTDRTDGARQSADAGSDDTERRDTKRRSAKRNTGAADAAPDAATDQTSSPSPEQESSAMTTTPTSSGPPETSDVTPQDVGDAAVAFMDGLTAAFGADATSTLTVDDLSLEVSVTGSELGLLVGPGGRTLNAIQDLARVSAQRRLGDHDTRLRIDVAGYRERREAALADFARNVAEQVRSTGTARSLEPMTSADRKVVHDILNDEDGVTSRSEGDDPNRRIIVEPA